MRAAWCRFASLLAFAFALHLVSSCPLTSSSVAFADSQTENPSHPTPAVTRGKSAPAFQRYRSEIALMCGGIQADGRLDLFIELVKLNSERDPACRGCRPLFRALAQACAPPSRGRAKSVKLSKNEEGDGEEQPETEPDEPALEPTVPFKQREPSMDAILGAERFGQAAADVEGAISETYQAFSRLAEVLRFKRIVPQVAVEIESKGAGKDSGHKSSHGKSSDGSSIVALQQTRAEKEYFETLALALLRPFGEYLKTVAAEEKSLLKTTGSSSQESGVSAADLFDY